MWAIMRHDSQDACRIERPLSYQVKPYAALLTGIVGVRHSALSQSIFALGSVLGVMFLI
jgi:hypothetical protein